MVAQEAQTRVVVADGHPLFTLGVRTLLASNPTMQIVGEARDGERTLQVVVRTRPDILLLDWALEHIPGPEVLNRLPALKLPTRTVVVADAMDGGEMRDALIRGARGVLLKHVPIDLLAKCIRQVTKGECWIGRDNVSELVEALQKSAIADRRSSDLSGREKKIVAAVLEGASNKDIAWQLGLNEQTVKNNLRRIFAKLRVANRVELAVHAKAHHLTGEDDTSPIQKQLAAPRNDRPTV